MKATDILRHEHQVILQMLGVLEVVSRRARTDGRLDAADARDLVGFFRTFADQCHHGKEEVRLFPVMEQRGVPRAEGPIGVMLQEHVLGRACVQAMGEAADAVSAGDEQAVKAFSEAAQRYIALLRGHIDKEDHCLFPMADQVMSPDDQQALLEDFQRVESDQIGEKTLKRLLETAERQAAKHGVAALTTPYPYAGGRACG